MTPPGSASGAPAGLRRADLPRWPEQPQDTQDVVVRPSLRAAVERFLTVFTTLLAVALPLAIGYAVQALTGQEADVDPSPAFLGGLAGINLAASIVLPAVVSIAPAVQIAFTRYVFDDEGVRERVQFMSRTERRVQWEKVTALHHRRTLLDRVLGIERLDIVAYGERGTTLHLIGLRNAPSLRNIVARQMRRNATIAHLVSND